MKCPRCQQKTPKRYGPKCGGCDYVFVFSDIADMTDGRWAWLLAKASGNATYSYTERQLFGVYARHQKRTRRPKLWFGVAAFGALFGAGMLARGMAGEVPLMLASLAAVVGIVQSGQPAADRTRFEQLLQVYLCTHKLPDLIAKPGLRKAPKKWRENDIYDYGVEGVLVVDDDLLVDLLVRNEIHAAERIAVISRSGYPDYLKPAIKRVLSESADVPVFVLHGTDPDVQNMEQEVRESDLGVQPHHVVVDLGWRVEDALRTRWARDVQPSDRQSHVTVDVIPPRILFGALALAIAEVAPLAAALGVSELRGDLQDDGDLQWRMWDLEHHFG